MLEVNPQTPSPSKPGRASDPLTWIMVAAAVVISVIAIWKMYPQYQATKLYNQWWICMRDDTYPASIIPAMQKLIKAKPNDPSAAAFPGALGRAYISAGQYPQAIEILTAPADRQYLAQALWLNGDRAKAVEIYHDIVKKTPAMPIANYYLGVAAFEANNLPLAAVHFMRTASNPQFNALSVPYREKILAQTLGKVDLVDTVSLQKVQAQLQAGATSQTLPVEATTTSGTVQQGAATTAPTQAH